MPETFRALIIEDNPVDAHLFRAVLSPLSLDIDIVNDGNAGFEKLKHGAYDLALLDLLLPNASGIELLRRIERESVPLPPTIVCSAISGETYVMECLKLGASGYLIKPISPAQLLNAVSDCLHFPSANASRRAERERSKPQEPLTLMKAMAEMTNLRGTGRILAQTDDGTGVLEYQSGRLASARFQNLSGLSALERLRAAPSLSILIQRAD